MTLNDFTIGDDYLIYMTIDDKWKLYSIVLHKMNFPSIQFRSVFKSVYFIMLKEYRKRGGIYRLMGNLLRYLVKNKTNQYHCHCLLFITQTIILKT